MNRKIVRLVGLVTVVALLAAGGILTASAATPGGRSTAAQPREVYLGGMPFGVKFFTRGVLVVGFCDVDGEGNVNPARDAGIQIKDVITAIDGTPLESAADLTAAVESSEGRSLTFTVKRKTKDGVTDVTVTVTPRFSPSEDRYKTGVWVRDSGAGIGTVTYIDPDTNRFGGLGHGICDSETGELIPMKRGQVCDVTISGIDKGQVGTPGSIKGYFAPGKTGTLLSNTERGVFGMFSTCPAAAETRVPVAEKREVKEGKATIRCTLDDGSMKEYNVTIGQVDTRATGSKCFTVTVTDPSLIAKTGGIVQGMSGSPIVQNGKLIGAVTHVLVNDPTQGYGIFIENMLDAAG